VEGVLKNEPSQSRSERPSLEQRFADQPKVIAELHQVSVEMERALAQGALAHEVGWASAEQQSPACQASPGASKHAKENCSGKGSSAPSRSANKSGA
jgi:hypothetical protein